jgi:hypothetical protein
VSCWNITDMTEVNSTFCSADEKPATQQACATSPCAQLVRWTVSEWGACDADCGGGQKSRSCTCVSKVTGELADEGFCADWPKPETTIECNTASCDFCRGGLETCSNQGTCKTSAQVRHCKCLSFPYHGEGDPDRWCTVHYRAGQLK